VSGNLDELMQLPPIDGAVGLLYRSVAYQERDSSLNSGGTGRRLL
jgi:hypothetical protein